MSMLTDWPSFSNANASVVMVELMLLTGWNDKDKIARFAWMVNGGLTAIVFEMFQRLRVGLIENGKGSGYILEIGMALPRLKRND